MKPLFVKLVPILPFLVLALAAAVAGYHVLYYW